MQHQLPPLPYEMDALAPHISRETLEYHYGKHHAQYVAKLNELIKGTEFADMSLEEIVKNSSGAVFNNAAQAWNHAFYWNSLSPKGGEPPQGELADRMAGAFGSYDGFKKEFTNAALKLFGSGWCWLVMSADGSLSIETTANADNPIVGDRHPLITCDVWEHAYYIDHRNARAKYLDAFWHLVNWRFAARNIGSEFQLENEEYRQPHSSVGG